MKGWHGSASHEDQAEYRKKEPAPEGKSFQGDGLLIARRGLAKQTAPGTKAINSLFDHLDFPIFGEEGDIFTFIYIVEG